MMLVESAGGDNSSLLKTNEPTPMADLNSAILQKESETIVHRVKMYIN